MKKYFISFILFILGIVCLIAYTLIGSKVLDNGVLQEPFWLIPTSLVFLFGGLLYGLVVSIRAQFKNPNKEDTWMLGIFGLVILSTIIYTIISIPRMNEVKNAPVISEPEPQPPNPQIANPASENCVKVGGNLQMQKKEDGSEYGLCYFEDARACEEWALFRGECQVGGMKTTGYDTIDQKYCAWSGGSTFAVPNSVCKWKDGKECSTIDFYNGKCSKN
ncbi:MAG: DUF333 domain-containing protein [Candidatus Jorgensenbacteria bacterium]|nr:DUF333 domain-containing protein [Candidatus Jorgensenbacteria bacterium]